jgi:hypothetical protein
LLHGHESTLNWPLLYISTGPPPRGSAAVSSRRLLEAPQLVSRRGALGCTLVMSSL